MRAVLLAFDTLARNLLPPYGCTWTEAPNFTRLAERSVVFDNCYAGSMPCIPARRELHTARWNFLHRSWGPLEPFDDSMPELLDRSGVHTHLATDHEHYWEDGGASYHNRYTTFEFFRGQEGDTWVSDVAGLRREGPDEASLAPFRIRRRRQDRLNREHMLGSAGHNQTRLFDAGVDFLRRNHAEDRWFLQLESFDPHEPYFVSPDFEPDVSGGTDWPAYQLATEGEAFVEATRRRYSALLSMCDASLGRVLDAFDEFDLWRDTMLIVWTDHGFLFGEHGWWAKGYPPWYDELIHTPLFIWDPRVGVAGERRDSLVQTIDLGPTLLDAFDAPIPADMQGRPLRKTLTRDEPVRTACLFGRFGQHVSVTDGRYVYMRAPVSPDNTPLNEYTLMPTHMRTRFAPAELVDATLAPPSAFTKEVPTVRIPGSALSNPYVFGTMLFDLETDPQQQTPLVNDELELRMCELLVALMREADAPADQFERLGLPVEGPPQLGHLLAREQHAVARAGATPLPELVRPLSEVLEDEALCAIVRRHLPHLVEDPRSEELRGASLFELAAGRGATIAPAVYCDLVADIVNHSREAAM